MSRRFAILNLPSLNISRILLNLNPIDLIEFSLLSSKCTNLVRTIRLPYTEIELLIAKDRLDVIVKTGDKECFRWLVNSNHAKKVRDWRKINGRKMRFLKFSVSILSKCPQPALSFSKVSRFLIDLLRCRVTFFQLYPDGIQNLPLLVSGFRSCLDMRLAGNEQMANEDLAFLLENVQVTRDFTFWIQPKPDFICPQSFRLQSRSFLIIGPSKWFTRQVFLNSNCEYLCVPYNPNINCFDIADFVEAWLNSEDTRIKRYTFSAVQLKFEPTAFERLNPRKWDPKERARSYPESRRNVLDCSDGMDILRNDGLLATILITSLCCKFVVWHERFPNTA